jgi:hypothetical protein
LGTKIIANLSLAGNASQAKLVKRKAVNHIFFSGIFSLSMSLGENVEQPPRLPIDQRREMFLFRNGRASTMDFPEIKGSCRSYASDRKRLKSGTIPAIFSGYETLGTANCPTFTNISSLN